MSTQQELYIGGTNCFDNTIRIVFGHLTKWSLRERAVFVHAICTQADSQERFVHGWVQLLHPRHGPVAVQAGYHRDEFCFVSTPLDVFVESYGVVVKHSYSFTEACLNIMMSGVPGAWNPVLRTLQLKHEKAESQFSVQIPSVRAHVVSAGQFESLDLRKLVEEDLDFQIVRFLLGRERHIAGVLTQLAKIPLEHRKDALAHVIR